MNKTRKSSIQLHQGLISPLLQNPNDSKFSDIKSLPYNDNSPTLNFPKSVKFIENTITHKYLRDSSTVSEFNDSENDQNLNQNNIQEKQKKNEQLKKLTQKKIAIGGGFNLDMSDFFKFRTLKKIESQGFRQLVVGGYLAWIILLYFVCNSAIIPAWIMSVKANKILRICWRFLLQAIFMIPFVLYQRRTGNESVKKKFSFEHILKFEGLKKVYISSIGTSIWFSIILSCFQWTYISHALVLGSLSNFFLSINRSINHSTHSLQPGGQIFVIVGILFNLADSYLLDTSNVSDSVWNVINSYYLTRKPIQRVLADLVIVLIIKAALSGAFIISKFSQKTADLKSFYPPFLSMFLVNISVSIHVGLAAYFLNGATFDRDTAFGIWALFTDAHFGGFFYMAVILSFGTYLSFTLISKMFNDPIIPALAMTLQPLFATFFLNLISVQSMPGSFSIYGYIFVLCGVFLILIGQFLLQRENEKKEKIGQMEKEMNEKIKQKRQQIQDAMMRKEEDEKPNQQTVDKHKIHEKKSRNLSIFHREKSMTV